MLTQRFNWHNQTFQYANETERRALKAKGVTRFRCIFMSGAPHR